MAWMGSDGSEHESQYDRDLHEKVNLGKESKGPWDSMYSGTLSGLDIARLKAILKIVVPIVAAIAALYGLFLPIRVMLIDHYITHIPTYSIIIVCTIIVGAAFFPVFKFVLVPVFDGDKIVPKLLLALGGLVLVVGCISAILTLPLGFTTTPINQQLDIRWRNSFYTFDYAKVSADNAVLRAAPEADAEAVLTLEQGEEVAIHGDAGNGWYFAREREIKDNVRNFGYIQADAVTLNNPGAKVKAMRPVTLLADNVSIHRARRWNSMPRDQANKGDYVLAAGASRSGWTPVYKANTEGWNVGYINDALLFFDDGTGAEAPAEPKGVAEIQWDVDTIKLFNFGTERYRFARMNGSEKMSFTTDTPADWYTEVPVNGRVILLDEETKQHMAPAVYNGRMGFFGRLDWKRPMYGGSLPPNARYSF